MWYMKEKALEFYATRDDNLVSVSEIWNHLKLKFHSQSCAMRDGSRHKPLRSCARNNGGRRILRDLSAAPDRRLARGLGQSMKSVEARWCTMYERYADRNTNSFGMVKFESSPDNIRNVPLERCSLLSATENLQKQS